MVCRIFRFMLLRLSVLAIGGLIFTSPAPALESVSQIAGGNDYSCALTTLGKLKCWGANEFGQLGDGTDFPSLKPVEVRNLSEGVTLITRGGLNNCVVTSAGAVKCWGINLLGQAGDGTTDDRYEPVAVSGLGSGVSQVAVNSRHACAATTAGAALCWGGNGAGQLGDGTKISSLTPVRVLGLSSGVKALAAEMEYTCALTTAGRVMCWGVAPSEVSGFLGPVKAIAAGMSHICALTDQGAVQCWGDNSYGQLGDGTTTSSNRPLTVGGLETGVKQIGLGSSHSCAVTTEGAVRCWGNNYFGQLGDGTTEHRRLPVAVSGLSSGIKAVAPGGMHSCALTETGLMKCWGYNGDGQLGDGTLIDRLTPVDVGGGRCRLSGTVKLQGAGLSQVSIDGGPLGKRTTDEDGWYAFDGLPEDTSYTLTPSKSGYTFSPRGVSSVLVGDASEDFTASPQGLLSLSGKVKAGRKALAGVAINGGALGATTTDRAGRYSFRDVPYGTKYKIRPAMRGYKFSPKHITGTITENLRANFSASRK
jgi:hypothetical protein